MYVSEAKLQEAIVKRIKEEWPQAWVFHPVGGPFQQVGVPDLLICVEGMLIGMEIKHQKPGETEGHARLRTTATQRHTIKKINAAGGMAGTVLSVGEAVGMVRRAFTKREKLSHGT